MGTPDKLIVVSSDSHAGVPHELWSQYLSPEYHDLLPALEEDNTIYPTVIWLLTAQVMKRPDLYEAHHTGGYRGLFDSQVRLQEMDREGVAAELIYHGDFRCGDMFHNITNKKYPLGAWEAGAKGWNRWASDTFGFATDRFLLIGAVGPCVDMDATRAELSWISDHGFTGTYVRGSSGTPTCRRSTTSTGTRSGPSARSEDWRSSSMPDTGGSRASPSPSSSGSTAT